MRPLEVVDTVHLTGVRGPKERWARVEAGGEVTVLEMTRKGPSPSWGFTVSSRPAGGPGSYLSAPHPPPASLPLSVSLGGDRKWGESPECLALHTAPRCPQGSPSNTTLPSEAPSRAGELWEALGAGASPWPCTC